MNDKEFYERVTRTVGEYLGKEYECQTREMLSIHVSLNGLTIHQCSDFLTPTIYLNAYKWEYEKGRTMESIVTEIIDIYDYHRKHAYVNELEAGKGQITYARIKDLIVVRTLDAQKNHYLLREIPHFHIEELKCVGAFFVESETTGTLTDGFYIRNEHLQSWNISREELLSSAVNNMNRRHQLMEKKLEDIMMESYSEKIF